MREENTVRYTRDSLPESQTDWERFDALTDDEIERAVAEDPDAPPLLDDEFWRNARVVHYGGGKTRVTMHVDDDVLHHFKSRGRGYQTRMNAVLRAYVYARKARREERIG